ncbi:4-hydroxy-tetrahydrodipicolinate synthase [Pelagibacterales bacterium]|jgi:4-hydroxy-tetrahydrodipicolinate synthase|nr:4-hydroxy-tetrahydrodipicolinate synthase [Pelagibacterales bacterium]|tara:strand:+ start:2158 stop:3033 length:876 start_codon:yes stop_codon:yes gene_type:complete
MFKGSFTALITPFKDGKFDETSFRSLIDFQLKSGTHGLVPTGTTGESPTLSHEEHIRIVEVCIEQANKKAPVIAGTGSNSTEEAIYLTKHAEKAGADAALVVTPYYNKPSQEGLLQHFTKIANSVDIPIVIYNIPGRSIVDMSNETMSKLFEVKNIVGVKDATGDIPRVYFTRSEVGNEYNMLSGDDSTTLAFMTYGGHGAISVTSNIAPKLCSDFHSLCMDKNFYEASLINDKLMPLHRALFLESSPGPVKYAASKLDLCSEEVRLPVTKINNDTKKIIDNALRHASLIK